MKSVKYLGGVIAALALASIDGRAHAAGGYSIQGAKIRSITNTDGNGLNFSIFTTGGSGPCSAANKYLTFSLSGANQDKDKLARAYSAAMAAMMADKTINVWNYTDSNDCQNVSFIEVLK